jgi:hypothetical protein
MKTSAYTLIPSTQFGSSNGNYDGVQSLFSGDPAKAAAYYSKDKSVQTLSWYLESTFRGVITIEATLDSDIATTNYFPIHTISVTTAPDPENDFINLTGNYTWIRATISDFTAGAIGKVSLGY